MWLQSFEPQIVHVWSQSFDQHDSYSNLNGGPPDMMTYPRDYQNVWLLFYNSILLAVIAVIGSCPLFMNSWWLIHKNMSNEYYFKKYFMINFSEVATKKSPFSLAITPQPHMNTCMNKIQHETWNTLPQGPHIFSKVHLSHLSQTIWRPLATVARSGLGILIEKHNCHDGPRPI